MREILELCVELDRMAYDDLPSSGPDVCRRRVSRPASSRWPGGAHARRLVDGPRWSPGRRAWSPTSSTSTIFSSDSTEITVELAARLDRGLPRTVDRRDARPRRAARVLPARPGLRRAARPRATRAAVDVARVVLAPRRCASSTPSSSATRGPGSRPSSPACSSGRTETSSGWPRSPCTTSSPACTTAEASRSPRAVAVVVDALRTPARRDARRRRPLQADQRHASATRSATRRSRPSPTRSPTPCAPRTSVGPLRRRRVRRPRAGDRRSRARGAHGAHRRAPWREHPRRCQRTSRVSCR